MKSSLTGIAIFLFLLFSSASRADISGPTGGDLNGKVTGTVAVHYGENGKADYATITDENGDKSKITNGPKDRDLKKYLKVLEAAAASGKKVTVTADFGDVTGVEIGILVQELNPVEK